MKPCSLIKCWEDFKTQRAAKKREAKPLQNPNLAKCVKDSQKARGPS